MEGKININEIITPWQESISEKTQPLPYPISWIIIAELFFLFHFTLEYLIIGEHPYLIINIILSVITAIQTSAVIWASKSFENFYVSLSSFLKLDSKQRYSWYKKELEKIFDYKKSIALGIFIGVAIPLTIFYLTSWYNNLILNLSFAFIVFIAAFTMGCALFNLIMTSFFVFSLGKYDIKITIYQHPTTSVKSIGVLYFKFSFIAIVTYTLWVIAFLLSPLKFNLFTLMWLLPIGFIIILYFILPQLKIHNVMANVKSDKMLLISERLENAIERAAENPSQENISRLAELREVQNQVSEMGEWPFNIRILSSIVTSVIIPMALILFQVLLGD